MSLQKCDIQGLLARMKSGDRDAAAEFVTRYGSRIRRRIRGKLGPQMRRIFDSQEILSTVGRRLDMYVREGQLEAASEGQLWTLVFRMATHAVTDKARVCKRFGRSENEDTPFAQKMLRLLRNPPQPTTPGAGLEVQQAIEFLDDPIDRSIVSFWVRGIRHKDIATRLDLSPALVRKRWQRICQTLRQRYVTEVN